MACPWSLRCWMGVHFWDGSFTHTSGAWWAAMSFPAPRGLRASPHGSQQGSWTVGMVTHRVFQKRESGGLPYLLRLRLETGAISATFCHVKQSQALSRFKGRWQRSHTPKQGEWMHLCPSWNGLSVLSGQELFIFLLHVKYTHLPSQDPCKFNLITTSGSGSKSRIS